MWSRLLVIAACTIAPATAAARRNDPDATLTAQDVQRYFAPHLASVRSCYLAHGRGKRADGSVRLELIIHPNGSIYRFDLVAPGVDAPWLGKLDRCLRALVPTWHLPPRKGFTTAIIPFLFHKTSSPGAGPIESCWDPRGCPPGKQGGT
ncbi:MAG: hypothetical protein ABI867_19130 [Kofleriaceae bacterium]